VRDRGRKRHGRHNFKQGEAAGTARPAIGSASRAERTTKGNCTNQDCRGLDEGSKLAKPCGALHTAALYSYPKP